MQNKLKMQLVPRGALLNKDVNAFLLIITLHDFFKYASRELGGVAASAPFIQNTALLYAVNGQVHRIASGLKPHYDEDFRKFSVYVTPAKLMEYRTREVIGNRMIDFSLQQDPVKITYNAVNTVTQLTETGRLAVPTLGTYLSYPPLSTFIAYSLGETPPPLIRIGKKLAPARVLAKPLRIVKINKTSDHEFIPSHPVNPTDLPSNAKILSAEMYPMPPISVLLNATIKGPHLVLKDDKNNAHIVAIPSREKYPSLMI